MFEKLSSLHLGIIGIATARTTTCSIVPWNKPTTALAIKAVIKLIKSQGVRFLIDSLKGPPILLFLQPFAD